MAIAIRGTTPATTATTSDPVSLTLNGTRQPNTGDVLIIVHHNNYYTLANMATPTVGGSSAGVNAIINGSFDRGTDFAHAKSYYYVVGSTGDLTVAADETGAADEEKSLVVYVLSGVDTATPIDTAANALDGVGSLPHAAPSVSPTSSDAFLICHVSAGPEDSGAWTPPGTMSEQYDSVFGGALSYTGGTQQLAASGATGTRTYTSANLVTAGMLSIAVKTSSGAAAVASPEPPRLWAPLSAPFIGPHSRALQLFGNAVTDQWPALIETAVAADALTVAAVFSVDDATSAAADSLAVAAAVPLAEATNTTTDELSVVQPADPTQTYPSQAWWLANPGMSPHPPVLQLLGDASGARSASLVDIGTVDDELALAPAIPLTETAAADDSVTVVVTVPLAETAAATDALVVAAAAPLDDTGAGTDSLSVNTGTGVADAFQAPLSLPGMFVSPRLAAPQILGDMATGLVNLSDTAAGSDSLTVAPAVPLSDTATGSDSLTVAATAALGDTAAADDVVAVAQTVALTDTASAADSLSVSVLGEIEQNQAWPQHPVDPPPLQLLGETAVATASVNLADFAAADDSLAISVTITVSDVAAAADVMSAQAGPLLEELVSAADALAIVVVLGLADTATGTDNIFIGGSGIQGNVYPRGSSDAPGSGRPRGSRQIIGSAG